MSGSGNSLLEDFTTLPMSFSTEDKHCAPSVLAGLYDMRLYPGANVDGNFHLSGTQWNAKRERDDSYGIVQFFAYRYVRLCDVRGSNHLGS